jgi:hypothetical protein
MTFLSRTGLSTECHEGRKWTQYEPGSIAEVGLTLEEKAALTCQTGNWPHNDRAWARLPRWQRAELIRRGIRDR